MKKKYTLFALLLMAILSTNAQVLFKSNFQNWLGVNNDSIPSDFKGATNNFLADSIIKLTTGGVYGTNNVRLVNSTSSGKRFSTDPMPVTNGTSYEVKIWVKGQGDVAARIWSGSYAGSVTYQNINTNSWTVFSQTVTANATVPDGQFIIYVRNSKSANGHIQIDSLVVSNVSIATVSIKNIQTPGNQGDTSQYYGQTVNTGGIVTAVKSAGKYWVQSGTGQYAGVYVFDSANNGPAKGDSVTFTATVAEYFGLTELINISNFSVVSSGNQLPTVTIVTASSANTELYEGVLIKVLMGQCTSDTTGNSYQEWKIDDGSGDVIVDGFIFPYGPILGTYYNVTGVLDYNFSNFKILPRDINDIQILNSVNEFETPTTVVFPNPANDFLVFKLSEANTTIKIMDSMGREIEQFLSSENIYTYNTSKLSSGIYFYTVKNKNSENFFTDKFVVNR